MKKILALLALCVYMFSINSLVHASTMGFLHTTNHQNIGHCHGQDSSSEKPSIDCCELVFSNNYSQNQIKLTTVVKIMSFVVNPVSIPTIVINQPIVQQYSAFVAPSGWDPNIKYQKFSDLMGIVVDLA